MEIKDVTVNFVVFAQTLANCAEPITLSQTPLANINKIKNKHKQS
ncbi:hypothetical protein Epro_1101 [Endomicrobium proavitum]|uniref:Uncharacterized protein n=1 Tax=Endomicrobium proavitum TaxID=1408281 RepID=A0A0G3WKT6_9BACT|nr:hypothetical protein Epro_1101 [Endomicrobium proavitum]